MASRRAVANTRTAIGWTLTGQMNSPNTNLAWHYASEAQKSRQNNDFAASAGTGSSNTLTHNHPGHSSKLSSTNTAGYSEMADSSLRPQMPNFATGNSISNDTNDASLLLNLNSPYNQTNVIPYSPGLMSDPNNPYSSGPITLMDYNNLPPTTMPDFGDMMIESQDVDMSMLGLGMMPWFESYPTPDMLSMFDTSGQETSSGAQQDSNATGGQGS